MPNLSRILYSIFSFSLLFSVIYFVPPPSSWIEASIFQILIFFIPLLLTLTFFINLFLKYFPNAFIFSLGLVILITLYSINSLNLFSTPLTLALTLIVIKIFPKLKYRSPRFLKSLTKPPNIPKITRLRKQSRYEK